MKNLNILDLEILIKISQKIIQKENKLINIFILNGLQDYNLKRFFNSNLIPVINSIEEYIRIKNSGLKFAIHVDTGINRLGIPIEKINEIDFKNKNTTNIVFYENIKGAIEINSIDIDVIFEKKKQENDKSNVT